MPRKWNDHTKEECVEIATKAAQVMGNELDKHSTDCVAIVIILPTKCDKPKFAHVANFGPEEARIKVLQFVIEELENQISVRDN